MGAQVQTDLGERIELPNGTALYYVDADHAYYRCKTDNGRGRRYTGVTTAIKPIDFEPDRLMKWAAKQNAVGVAMLAAEALEHEDAATIRSELLWLDPGDPERIWEALLAAGLTYEDIREARAVVGTNIHRLVLEALARGEQVPEYEALSREEQGYAEGVVDFWLDHKPEPLQSEQIVADEHLGVAGRFDLRARFSPCADLQCPCQLGGIGLIDCKTSSWVSEKDNVQAALYAHLAELCGFGESNWTAILHVRADGTYRLWKSHATAEIALDDVRLYRHRAAIRKAAREEWKKRR